MQCHDNPCHAIAGRKLNQCGALVRAPAGGGKSHQFLELRQGLQSSEVVVIGEDRRIPPSARFARGPQYLESSRRLVERAVQAGLGVGELGRPRVQVRIQLGQQLEGSPLPAFGVQDEDAVGEVVEPALGCVHS